MNSKADWFCVGVIFGLWFAGDTSKDGANIGLVAALWLTISIIRDAVKFARARVKP